MTMMILMMIGVFSLIGADTFRIYIILLLNHCASILSKSIDQFLTIRNCPVRASECEYGMHYRRCTLTETYQLISLRSCRWLVGELNDQ